MYSCIIAVQESNIGDKMFMLNLTKIVFAHYAFIRPSLGCNSQ